MRIVCLVVLSLCLAIVIAGCSAPYVMKMDRVDQKIEGNRGYLKGTPPPVKDRGDLKRPFIAVDIDLPDMAGSEPAKTKEVSGKLEEAAITEETPVAKDASIK